MKYITRVEADKEIESMINDCKVGVNNTYHFPMFGNLYIKLDPNKTIKDFIVKYIEDKYNLTAIEKVVINR